MWCIINALIIIIIININLHSTMLLPLFIALDEKQQQTGLKVLRIQNV